MADKETKLNIVIRTVDAATAKIKAINDRLEAITKPISNFKDALGDLRKSSGLDEVLGGFNGVGSAIGGLLSKLAMVGGVAGLAVAGLFHLVNEFDELGDKAERFGVGVDFLASMRYAAEKAGAPVDALDNGLQSLSVNLGKLSAGTGRMKAFLDKVSPALERQLKGAKNNEEAFYLLAAAMDKIKDPAKRSALAMATLGDASLAPLLNQGEKGVKALAARYIDLAGSQEDAATKAGAVDDSLHDLHATTDGLKAAILSGLAPALKVIVDRLSEWFKGHRDDVKQWATQIGEKLPSAVNAVVDAISGAITTVTNFVDDIGGLTTVAVALAAVIVGPVISAIIALGTALLTTPVGWFLAAVAAIGAVAYEIHKHWDGIVDFFSGLWDGVKSIFGPIVEWLADVLSPFLAVPKLIIQNWGSIANFFGDMWDAVTGVFKRAWDFISGIVDKVVDAASSVKGAAGDVLDFINPFGGPPQTTVSDATNRVAANLKSQALYGSATPTVGAAVTRLVVDFANAPRGTRVTTDPQSTADVELNLGYQMMGLGA